MAFAVLTDAGGTDQYVDPVQISRFFQNEDGSIRLYVGATAFNLDPSYGPDDISQLVFGAPVDAQAKLTGSIAKTGAVKA